MRYLPFWTIQTLSLASITSLPLITTFWFIKLHLKLNIFKNWREIPSLLAINFGICDIFAILYYLNLDACIDNVSAIVCSLLVWNFIFKVKYWQNQRKIPSLLVINFGIWVKYGQNWTEIPSLSVIYFGTCEIFAILYHLYLVTLHVTL